MLRIGKQSFVLFVTNGVIVHLRGTISQGLVLQKYVLAFHLVYENTGMSPEEILKMKWKQIEIVDVGRINSKGEKVREVAYVRTIKVRHSRHVKYLLIKQVNYVDGNNSLRNTLN